MSDLIRTTAELEGACAVAKAEGLLCLDTEFVWKRTYRPILGIVQIGTREHCWAVDCLTGLDPSALRSAIEDPSVTKVLHDARQDLMHLWHWTGGRPKNVFDTQQAASFADFPHGIGLQKVLFDAIGVGLPKTETLTDWTMRPLTESQVRYALDDVRYLPALRDEILRRAEAFGTRAWLEDERAVYDNSSFYDDCDASELWKRVRVRPGRLNGRGRSVLKAVTALREDLAKKWNLPRTWLGDDASLLAMADQGRVEKVCHRLRGGQGDTIRALYAEQVAKALETPEELWPEDPHIIYIAEVREAADKALDWLEKRAAELHVAPATIANRATVTAYVDDVDDESNPLASGWRYESVGREMAERFGVD